MQKQKNASKQKREPFTRLTVFERTRIELRYNEGMSLRVHKFCGVLPLLLVWVFIFQ